jgi:CRISPR-associated protein Csb1
MPDLYTTVRAAVAEAAGISVNATLTTLAGSRHVLPPTYADAPHKHNMTEPDAHGVATWVSIDSAASFANRIEDQLKRADFGLDPIRVQVAGRTLSTLQMPHRAYDAILRDSSLNGESFRRTAIGQAIIAASRPMRRDCCATTRRCCCLAVGIRQGCTATRGRSGNGRRQ